LEIPFLIPIYGDTRITLVNHIPDQRLTSKETDKDKEGQEVGTLAHPLPDGIFSILYKETRSGEDILALKVDQTYRGGARHLCGLIEH
jgi:hypothetical protein